MGFHTLLEFQKHSRIDDDQRVLPLINIVFLLLIYVLIAGKVTLIDPFETKLPQSASESLARPLESVLYVSRDGRIALNGTAISQPELPDALTELGQLSGVRVQADGSTPAQLVVEVAQVLSTAGIGQIDLLTVPN